MASHEAESMSLLRFPNRQLPSRECCARNALTPTMAGVPYCGITILSASHGFTARKSGTSRAQLDKVVDYRRKVCVRQNPAAPCLDVLTVGFGDMYSLLTTVRGDQT